MVSALVILKPAGGASEPGRQPGGFENTTTANIASRLPDASAAKSAVAHMKAAGFKCGPLVGTSFSVEGAASLFSKVFGGAIRENDRGYFHAEEGKEPSRALPLRNLPPAVRSVISTITFLEPPDFGPGNFGTNP
ncbi:MAG: hypothetical protein KIT83_19260 [Bryobacterales bacterium]|nr:hypothetical protein [Bryobacterales bacterium]